MRVRIQIAEMHKASQGLLSFLLNGLLAPCGFYLFTRRWPTAVELLVIWLIASSCVFLLVQLIGAWPRMFRVIVYEFLVMNVYRRILRWRSKSADGVRHWIVSSFIPRVRQDDGFAILDEIIDSAGPVDGQKAGFYSAYGSHGPTLAWKEHAEQEFGWRDWEFNSVVLNGGIQIERRLNSEGSHLKVDLTRSRLALFNNAGKKHLRSRYLTDGVSSLAFQYEDAVRQLQRGGRPDSVDIPESLSFRWANGGALVIAIHHGHPYFVLHYRGIEPCGWNLSNGASESSYEHSDINFLAVRETTEELIVLTSPLDAEAPRSKTVQARFVFPNIQLGAMTPSMRRRIRGDAFLSDHRRLRQQHDGIEIRYTTDRIEMECIDTRDKVTVHADGEKVIWDNVLFSVNPFELGIEVLKVFELELPADAEIVFGEVWPPGDCLIREPVMMVRVAAVLEAWRCGQMAEALDVDTAGVMLPPLSESDYVVFSAELTLRKRRVLTLRERESAGRISPRERLELHQLLEPWDEEFSEVFEMIDGRCRLTDKPHLQSRARTLCPVSAKAIDCFFEQGLHRRWGL